METIFSLALTSATSKLRNFSASSVLQNNLSHLESSQNFSSSVHHVCQRGKVRGKVFNQPTSPRPDRSDDPFLIGCTRVLNWDVTKEGGQDFTVHLWTF